MRREFPSTPDEAFEAAIEGAYYSDQLARMEMDNRLTRLPIDLGIPHHQAACRDRAPFLGTAAVACRVG